MAARNKGRRSSTPDGAFRQLENQCPKHSEDLKGKKFADVESEMAL
jgi:hypothetical protein